MAGRGQPKISLFPFMSVLACTIGALVMLLVAMSLLSVGASGAATRALSETKVWVEADRRATERERERLSEAEALWSRVDAALAARGLDPGLSRSTIEREIERDRQRRTLLERLDEIAKQERELRDQRDTIETTIDVLESRRETLPILIDATGLSRHLEPFFVECDEGGITAYRASDDFRYFVPRNELESGGDFARYLRRVRVHPGALLVLLVRPDGIETMNVAEAFARRTGVQRVARLPLPGKGELDWSLLRRAESGEG